MKIYIDGQYFQKADAKISVFDHGLLYGDGVFEGIRIYHGKIFKLREHIERLYRSAHAILLDIPATKEEMHDIVSDAVRSNNKDNGYIRLIVTRGEGALGIDPASCRKATIIVIVDDIQLYPGEYYQRGIEIITSSSRRMPPDSFDPRVKSLNYLNNIMAKLEARISGCLEAVMLNREGYVAECTGDNIFIVTQGNLFTPAPFHGALDGITRQTVLEIAGSLGINARQTALTRYDLYNADECFMTGSGAEIIPVTKIDGRIIGEGTPGAATKQLIKAFRETVERKNG